MKKRFELTLAHSIHLRCLLAQNRFVQVGGSVQDLIFVVLTIVFFLLSLGYVEFCDRIR